MLPDTGRDGFPLHVAIDLHKVATGPAVAALMVGTGTYTAAAWTYLALHGAYGVVWVVKDLLFPDRRWRRRVPWWSVAAAWAFLSLYWVAPAILVLGQADVVDPGAWKPATLPVLAGAVVLHTLGIVLMVGADVQKSVTLELWRQRDAASPGLLTTGFFRRVRHPNYLGEMLVYGSYALIVAHWVPWVILLGVWGLYFVPAMLGIDGRLSRYPGYEAWRRRAGLLLPRLRR